MAQENKEGKERTLYYLSRTLNGAELNYSPIEKTCLSLFFTMEKLKLSRKCWGPRICESLKDCREDLPTYDNLS